MKNRKILLLGAILLLGIGFALVTTTLYLNGNVNIEANTEDFDVKFTRVSIDNIDKTSETISEDGKTINFTTKELQALNDKSVLDFEVTNNSLLYDAEVSIECTSGEKGEYYQITKELADIISAKTTELGKVEVEKIKMAEEDIEEAFTCTLMASAKERTTKLNPILNKNIVNIDEECYKNKEAGSCAPGTEIRYMVNDSEEKTFYVLHDDGETLTLQQRENTVNTTIWNSEGNTKGPLTALSVLEEATLGWSNVNTLNYTIGRTVFKNNAFTGCSAYNNCTENVYSLGLKDRKARMITIQESSALGCGDTEGSCPKWMSNYLSNSIDFGGTVNYSVDWGYWTMSAYSLDSNRAWYHSCNGTVYYRDTTITSCGARAVIEINKYI